MSTTQQVNSNQTGSTNNQTQTSAQAPAWLAGAGQQNLQTLQGLQGQGFQPYSGNQVAPFSPQQYASFIGGNNVSNQAMQALPNAGAALNNYMTAGPQSVSTSAVNPGNIAAGMSPFMNQYVNMALQPQISNLNNQEALQSQLTQGQATSAGAFGDPRATMLQQNQNAANSLQEQGLVGNAYNAAFNTALGGSSQQNANQLAAQTTNAANQLNVGTTNANLAETALNRQLTGANAAFGQGTNATNLLNTLGGQQTAQTQAGLNAAYNQWMMGQQYPLQISSAINPAIGSALQSNPLTTNTVSAGNSTMNGTQTTSTPNNLGYALLGDIGGAFIGDPMLGNQLMGGSSGGSSGQGGGLGGVLGQAGANMFQGYNPDGSISGSQNVAMGQGYGVGFDANYNALPGNSSSFFAKGGRPPVGKPAIVGEKGPEVFVPDRPGTIIPHHVLKAAAKAASAKKRAGGIGAQLGIAA